MYRKLSLLIKDSLIYGIINSIAQSINILLLPILTRFFNPSEYGVIDIVSVSVSFVSVLVVLNLNSSMARYFYDYDDHKQKSILISTQLYLISITSIIFSTIFWLQSEYISYMLFDTAKYDNVIRVVLLLIPCSVFLDYLSLLLRMEKKTVKYGIVNIGDILLTIILSICFVIVFKLGIIGVFLARLISKTVMLGVCLLFTFGYFTFHVSWKVLKKTLAYSIPSAPAVFTTWANSSLSRYFILLYMNSEKVGIFGAGFKVGMGINVLVQAFRMGWLPFSMSILNDDDKEKIYKKVLTYYFILLFSFGTIITVCSKEILLILAGSEYGEAYKIIGFLVGGIVLQGAFNIVFVGSMIKEKSFVVTVSSLTSVIVNILLMQLLIPRIGITGAAIAFMATFITSFIICYSLSQKYFYIDYEVKKISWIFCFFLVVVIFSLYVNSIEISYITYILKALTVLFFFIGTYITSIDTDEVLSVKVRLSSKFNKLWGNPQIL